VATLGAVAAVLDVVDVLLLHGGGTFRGPVGGVRGDRVQRPRRDRSEPLQLLLDAVHQRPDVDRGRLPQLRVGGQLPHRVRGGGEHPRVVDLDVDLLAVDDPLLGVGQVLDRPLPERLDLRDPPLVEELVVDPVEVVQVRLELADAGLVLEPGDRDPVPSGRRRTVLVPLPLRLDEPEGAP
jgi:hypothetical protein